MARKTQQRRRAAVDRVIGVEGVCTDALAVMQQPSRRTHVILFAPFLPIIVVMEFVTLTNIVWVAELVAFAVLAALGEIIVDRFLIGLVPDGVVVISLESFTRRPTKVIKDLRWPVDIDVESRFTTYRISLDGSTYEAGGRSYPEWLTLIQKLEWNPVSEQ